MGQLVTEGSGAAGQHMYLACMYRVSHHLLGLGWVDLVFGHDTSAYPILLVQMGVWQNGQSNRT